MNRRRDRSVRQPERRGLDWVSDQMDNTFYRSSALGAFTMSRALLDVTTDGIFRRKDVMDFLSSDTGAETFMMPEVVVVGAIAGGKLAGAWRRSSDEELEPKLQEVCDTSPRRIRGFLGGACVVPVDGNQTGLSSIGYSLSQRARDIVSDDRQRVFSEVGDQAPSRMLPHVKLFETSNYELALELKAGLAEFRYTKMHFELGRMEPTMIPASDLAAQLPS